MKRVMALNIGVALTMGLLLSGCGKNAKPVTGAGGGTLYDYSALSMSPAINGLYKQLQNTAMNVVPYMNNQPLRTIALSGMSASVNIIKCTMNNNTSTQTVNVLGLFQLNFAVNTSNCGSQSNLATYTFQSATTDGIQFPSGNTGISKQQVLGNIFHPEGTVTGPLAMALQCNGPLGLISANVRQGYSTGSQQILDYVIRETCSGTDILHVRTHVIDTNLPLVANPYQIIQGKIINNNQYQQLSVITTQFSP